MPDELSADFAALDQAQRDLDDFDVALRRLDDGTYGRCEVCGEPLGVERSEEQPLLRRCAEHAD